MSEQVITFSFFSGFPFLGFLVSLKAIEEKLVLEFLK